MFCRESGRLIDAIDASHMQDRSTLLVARHASLLRRSEGPIQGTRAKAAISAHGEGWGAARR